MSDGPPAASAATRDDVLMARAARGDVAAFAELYDRHAPTLLALARRMLGSSSDAQDLVHDVFLEAWSSARDYDPARATVRVWLLVRARSRALDRRGRAAREKNASARLLQDEATVLRAATPQTERQIAVRQALSMLLPSVRETMELTFFEGLTALEIASRMHVPEGTVKSRLARGLQIAQKVLRQLEEESP